MFHPVDLKAYSGPCSMSCMVELNVRDCDHSLGFLSSYTICMRLSHLRAVMQYTQTQHEWCGFMSYNQSSQMSFFLQLESASGWLQTHAESTNPHGWAMWITETLWSVWVCFTVDTGYKARPAKIIYNYSHTVFLFTSTSLNIFAKFTDLCSRCRVSLYS